MLIYKQAPFFYVQSYVLAYDIMSDSMSFYLLTILNACSTFGRLFPNILADYLGPLNVLSMRIRLRTRRRRTITDIAA